MRMSSKDLAIDDRRAFAIKLLLDRSKLLDPVFEDIP